MEGTERMRYGYWRFDGQIRWYVPYVIPMSEYKSWRYTI